MESLPLRRRADLLGGRGRETQEHERTGIHGVPFESENFVNGVDRTFCPTVAAGDGDEAIQERVRGVRGLEARRGAKVVGRGIDRLAASDGRHHFRRSVTQAEGFHRDERAVVGPERDAKVQLEDAVRSEEQPVRAAARQDRSAKTGTLEVPAARWARSGECREARRRCSAAARPSRAAS